MKISEWFLPLGADCALKADNLQWIVMKKDGHRAGNTWIGPRWRPNGYVLTHKAIICRILNENECTVSETGALAFASLPDSFAEWKASFKRQEAA